MAMNPVTLFDDPTLSDELKLLQSSVRTFAEEKIKPIVEKYYWQEKQVPEQVIHEMGRLGYFGTLLPEKFGGSGLGTLAGVILAEELARGWFDVGLMATRTMSVGLDLMINGSDEQRTRYVPHLVSGELLPAGAFTEPEAGSDAANVKTTAVRDGNFYILNGTKTFCSFANRAKLICVMVRTDVKAEPKHRGLSRIIVEKEPGDHFDPPGLTGRSIPIIGYHGEGVFELFFEDYRVPAENIVGGEAGLNRGFYQLMNNYEVMRILVSALSVGVARAAYEAAVSYAANRVQFGYTITNFQAQRFRIAEMATDIMSAKHFTYWAAKMLEQGQRCSLEAGMAKLVTSEMVVRCTDAALRIHGGYGYTKTPVARNWLDGRTQTFGEGTIDIMKRIISDQILGKPIIPQ